MIRDLSKRGKWRSETYLEWVRGQPCVGCGVAGRQHAHHNIADRYGSEKASDAYALPLCPACHAELHADWREWEVLHGSQWRHAAKTLHEALLIGVLVLDARAAKELSQ